MRIPTDCAITTHGRGTLVELLAEPGNRYGVNRPQVNDFYEQIWGMLSSVAARPRSRLSLISLCLWTARTTSTTSMLRPVNDYLEIGGCHGLYPEF